MAIRSQKTKKSNKQTTRSASKPKTATRADSKTKHGKKAEVKQNLGGTQNRTFPIMPVPGTIPPIIIKALNDGGLEFRSTSTGTLDRLGATTNPWQYEFAKGRMYEATTIEFHGDIKQPSSAGARHDYRNPMAAGIEIQFFLEPVANPPVPNVVITKCTVTDPCYTFEIQSDRALSINGTGDTTFVKLHSYPQLDGQTRIDKVKMIRVLDINRDLLYEISDPYFNYPVAATERSRVLFG